MENINKEIQKILMEEFLEQEAPNVEALAPAAEVPMEAPKTKPTIVRFNKGREDEFQVQFSERGFAVEGTRLSFELIDHAMSKNFVITLEKGSGLVLDHVKMQQILGYKDKF